jgi:heat shock protein HtpX
MTQNTHDGRGLTWRILVTLALVLAVDLAFVGLVGFLLSPFLTRLRAAVAAAFGVGVPPVVQWVGIGGVALSVFVYAQLRYTRQNTLAEVDAETVGPGTHPDVHERLRRLARGSGVSKPRLAVAETEVANSFTVGGPGDAVVVVSEGLLEALDGDELDAVLAHELAHLKNRDATVMTLATFLPAMVNGDFSPLSDLLPAGLCDRSSLVYGVGLAGLYLFSAAVVGGPVLGFESAVVFVTVVFIVVLFGGVALGVLATPVVFLSRDLSRYREFAADRAGAVVTGDPAAMASALRTLDDDTRVPETDARRADATIGGLCLLPHGLPGEEGTDRDDDFRVEVQSHPPTGDRLARLRDLAAEMESGV